MYFELSQRTKVFFSSGVEIEIIGSWTLKAEKVTEILLVFDCSQSPISL